MVNETSSNRPGGSGNPWRNTHFEGISRRGGEREPSRARPREPLVPRSVVLDYAEAATLLLSAAKAFSQTPDVETAAPEVVLYYAQHIQPHDNKRDALNGLARVIEANAGDLNKLGEKGICLVKRANQYMEAAEKALTPPSSLNGRG